MDTWAQSMRWHREKRGLTRDQLADEAGVSENILYRYETGLSTPGLFNLVCLADALGVGLDEYIGRKKP